MPYSINIQNENAYSVDEIQLRQAIQSTLNYHKNSEDYSLSVVVTDSEAVRKLNQQFRGFDAPTDILSFPAEIPNLEDESTYLGDLIIAYPYTKMQAEKNQHHINDSLTLLVIHGTLHLLGYDHDTPSKRDKMWMVQATILKQLNISPSIVPDLEGEPAS